MRINYGQVCLETDRFAQGLAWVQSAYRRSSQPVYRLMEANFRMLQGDLDGASAVLDEVRRDAAIERHRSPATWPCCETRSQTGARRRRCPPTVGRAEFGRAAGVNPAG